uniref:Uncharacterized protein n=1 Tax=Pipistrellus kuhlii TaxID=59472 RepID=A0A7J7ZJP2_PIPKU|nr:hypothetical protein mPipKuh1_009478 [Pipistrellus kuhlii]
MTTLPSPSANGLGYLESSADNGVGQAAGHQERRSGVANSGLTICVIVRLHVVLDVTWIIHWPMELDSTSQIEWALTPLDAIGPSRVDDPQATVCHITATLETVCCLSPVYCDAGIKSCCLPVAP